MTKEKQQQFLETFKKFNKYDVSQGLQVHIDENDIMSYLMTVAEQHLSSPGVCHGGVISGMMDATLGLAALRAAINEDKICSTVEFKINYLTPALLGDVLQGTGKIEFKGSSLIICTGDIINGQSKKLIAKGMGTFKLYPLAKKAKTYGLSPS